MRKNGPLALTFHSFVILFVLAPLVIVILVAFTPDGRINLRNERYRTDPAPLVEGLNNYTTRFSRAYLRHLVMAGEILASTLVTLHNVHFYLDLVAQARAHIEAGDFAAWSKAWIERYEAGERETKAV